MTTNHRPTLESKRGRDITIKDTIQHARSGRGQTSLKLRLDISGAKIDHARGKLALNELESGSKRHKKNIDTPENELRLPADILIKDGADSGDNLRNITPLAVSETASETASESKTTDQTLDDSKPKVLEEMKDGESLENSENDSVSDALDSEDDDTEALMKELEKVREEKASRDKEKTTLGRNPLISSDGNDTIKKKSWRGSSAFSRTKLPSENSFTTDTLSSDTHKQFLSKYFK